MLKFDNVSFQYDVEDFSIIDHLSFDVQDGEFVSVIGASGCGKSTIFRLVNKLLLPASGEILVDGCNVHMESPLRGRETTVDTCRSRIFYFPGGP